VGGPSRIPQVADRHRGAQLTIRAGLEAGPRVAALPTAERPTALIGANDLLGRAAADLLFDEIASPHDHHHRQVVFKPELVVRASSG
jgi:hypothetical protein